MRKMISTITILVAGFFLFTTGVVSAQDALMIDETGNVGIGTTDPAYNLDVNGVAKVNKLITNGISGKIVETIISEYIGYCNYSYDVSVNGAGTYRINAWIVLSTGAEYAWKEFMYFHPNPNLPGSLVLVNQSSVPNQNVSYNGTTINFNCAGTRMVNIVIERLR